MKIKSFDRLSEITKNDGKVILYDDGVVGRSTAELSDIISDATTGKADKEDVYTKIEVNELLANFGGFEVVQADEEGKPDVDNPSTKTIYLVKDETVVGDDKYKEWIWTKNELEEFDWALIGETSFEFNLSAGTDLKYEDGVFSVNTNGSAKGEYSFVEGKNTFAGGLCDHVEGMGGIADDGGMNHIEGFQYHSYTSNGASSYAGKNVVQFYHTNIVCNGNSIDAEILYEYVKAFKDNFIVTCDYHDWNVFPNEWHYTKDPFYDPLIYKIIDVSLDEENTSVFNVTLDRPLPDDCTSGGIYLYGPTSFMSITDTGGPLSSGQILKTYRFSGLGFPGNNLKNVRTDNTFIYLSYSYTLIDGTEISKIYRILRLSDIVCDKSTNNFILTTEEGIEIPEILDGSYGITINTNNPTWYGNNHLEGFDTVVYGASYAHVEGKGTRAQANASHAEGDSTLTYGNASHAEGYKTSAQGSYSHAEGYMTVANGAAAHAEGFETLASGSQAHAEGRSTIASGNYTHAEGNLASAFGEAARAAGTHSLASGNGSVAEGWYNSAYNYAHAEGSYSIASGDVSHAEGYHTSAIGHYSHSEGYLSVANGQSTHAEGYNTSAINQASHSEGMSTVASGSCSHAEGYMTSAINSYSHTEGYQTLASGMQSHAEGASTRAFETGSHAEGSNTRASGQYSHAEGFSTTALGDYSHAEGQSTYASGNISHAEGQNTSAIDMVAHSQGYYTIAQSKIGTSAPEIPMFACGICNATSADVLFVVGNGSRTLQSGQWVEKRSDAFVVDQSGLASATKLATSGIPNVEAKITSIETEIGNIDTILQSI